MNNTTSISGTVKSSNGPTPLPGALVEIESASLPMPRDTVTNASGSYTFDEILPGNYIVKASFTGFQPEEKRNVLVSIGENREIDFTLYPDNG